MSRPNILLILADDMAADTPGCFGGLADTTPRLDAVAAEGMVFRRAHVPIAVCQPSRSAIMSGMWPHRNGAEGFEPMREGIPLLTHSLASVGYRKGIVGKVGHIKPIESLAWDDALDFEDLGMGRNPERYREFVHHFLENSGEQPWFLMANPHDPHRPFSGSAQEARRFSEAERASYPPPSKVYGESDEVPTPGYLPSLPEITEEWEQYLSSSRRCDDVVAALLDEVEAAGALDDTFVIFLSDNGPAVPFAKANCYLQSTLTPLILRWPGHIPSGGENTKDFVSMLDLFPTICRAAGVEPPPGLDGSDLFAVLDDTDMQDRSSIHTVFHETSRGQRFEMRCRQNERFGYIWNPWTDEGIDYFAENMNGLSWPSMEASDDPEIEARVDFYLHRNAEELYDLRNDPNSLRNLAEDPDFAAELATQRQKMRTWLDETGDPLASSYPH